MTAMKAWVDRRGRAGVLGPIVLGLAAFALLAFVGQRFETRRTAIPVPLPVYQIEGKSGNHQISLLNLPITQPGVAQVPIPVDVDGDLLPDVTVGVNLIDAQGVFNNPPDTGAVLSPNIDINRLVTAPILGQFHPKDLRINVVLTVRDLENEEPDTVVRFGYETGKGGTIPPWWKAVVGGLDKFFNPMRAVISTTGGYLGLDPGLADLGLVNAGFPYSGPNTVIGGIVTDGLDAKFDLRFNPFPNTVEVTYASDAEGQHITFDHGQFPPDEVDMIATADIVTDDIDLDGRIEIDRLPRHIGLDINMGDDSGEVKYASTSDGRPADLRATLRALATAGETPPINARADIEGLPQQMTIAWETPDDGPVSASFDSTGQGIGAIEARLTTFDGAPTQFTEWQPSRPQYANLQTGLGLVESDEILASMRLLRIRHAEFVQATDGGFEGILNIGDGETPLEAHVSTDLRDQDLPFIDATVGVFPLPDDMRVKLDPAGEDQAEEPLTVRYDSSEPVDVETSAKIAIEGEDPTPECVDDLVICAELGVRHIPTSLEVRLSEIDIPIPGTDDTRAETHFDFDAVPRDDGAAIDVFSEVTLGQDDLEPLHFEAELRGLPRFVRVLALEGTNEGLERLEIFTCDRDFDADVCDNHDPLIDKLGEVKFGISNFIERPAGFPAPSALAPLYVTARVHGNQTDAEFPFTFEATGRLTDIKAAQYLNYGDLIAVHTDVGANQDFTIDADAVDLPIGGEFGRLDLAADILVNSLPQDFNFCFGNAGRAVDGTPNDPLTAACERQNPFRDGTSLDSSPIAFNYTTNDQFNVHLDAVANLDGGTIVDRSDDIDAFADVEIDNIPNDFTMHMQVPADGENAPVRLLTETPTDSANLDFRLKGGLTTAGADCDDPHPDEGIVACAELDILDLPTHMSALVDTTDPGNTRIEATGCDWDFYGGTDACRDDPDGNPTDGEIGSLRVAGRLLVGQPSGVPVFRPTEDQYVVALVDFEDLDNFEAKAAFRIEEISRMAYRKSPTGYDVFTDVGDNTPFQAHVFADSRGGSLPAELQLEATADVLISPFPETTHFFHREPGEDQSTDPSIYGFTMSAPVTVNVDARLREVGAGPRCGDTKTICASVDIENIPKDIVAKIADTTEVNGADTVNTKRISVDADPFAPGPKPNVIVEATMGPNTLGLPIPFPLVGRIELLGLPRVVRARLVEVERDLPASIKTSTQLQRAEVHTCVYNEVTLECTGPEDGLDTVRVHGRNFLLRPNEFPPPQPDAPNYVLLTGRGRAYEANVQVVDIKGFDYVNDDGLTGARVRVGGGGDFAVKADIKNLDLGNTGVAALNLGEGIIDALVSARIHPLPEEIAFCMRDSGITPVPAASGIQFTALCEQADPFQLGGGAPNETPMSIAYDASAPIDSITTSADLTIRDADNVPLPTHIKGSLEVTDLPETAQVHIQVPEEQPDGKTQGPLRIRMRAVHPLNQQIDIRFSGQVSTDDAICEDPRPTADSLCASGFIENLPNALDVYFNPDETVNNLVIDTGGERPLDFENLYLAAVKHTADPNKAEVLVATANLLGLDADVRGSLDLPDGPGKAPAIDITADLRIDHVDGTFRNFIAPDPIVEPLPVRLDGVTGTSYIHVFQRGEFFKAAAVVDAIKSVSFRTVRDVNGDATGTIEAGLDFGVNQVIRAYADIVPDETKRINADVVLDDVPAGLRFCYRGKRTPGAPAAAESNDTACDMEDDDEGVIQFLGSPDTPNATDNPQLDDSTLLDVDAYVRLGFGGGTETIAGRVLIEDIPNIIRGTIPDGGTGDLDVGGYARPVGQTDDQINDTPTSSLAADGIDRIQAEAASFDITTPWTLATIPFIPHGNSSPPFPAGSTANQHAFAVKTLTEFHAKVLIGRNSGGPNASHLQRIRYNGEPCAKPAGFGTRPDYPYLPAAVPGKMEYTCVRVDFAQVGSGPDPLDLGAYVELGDGKVINLKQSGLTDIPNFVQINLTSTDALDITSTAPNRPFRPVCGSVPDGNAGNNVQFPEQTSGDCAPPLVRFDSASLTGTPILFANVEYGPQGRMATIRNEPVKVNDIPDVNATAGPTAFSAGPQANDTGVHAKVGLFDEGPAIVAGVRIAVPESLTVDQLGKWSSKAAAGTNYYEASDTKFHYAVRRSDGSVVARLGHLAAVLHLYSDGTQIVASDGGEFSLKSGQLPNLTDLSLGDDWHLHPERWGLNDATGTTRSGIDIPGEASIGLYMRDDKHHGKTGNNFIQIQGRISHEMDLRARVFGGPEFAVGYIEAFVLNIPAAVGPGYDGEDPTKPSFRLQAEIIAGASLPPAQGGPPSSEGSDCTFLLCAKTNIKVANARALFDFKPRTDTAAARLVKAVVNTSDGQGVGVQSFRDIDGGPTAPITVNASVLVDPLDVYFHAGIPFLGSADFALESSLNAGVSLDQIVDFKVRHRTLHIVAEDHGGFSTSRIGPIDFNIFYMSGSAWLLFVPLFTIDFFPPSPPPLAVPFYDCSAAGIVGGLFAAALPGFSNFLAMVQNNSLAVPHDTRVSVVVWPLDDARLHFGGVLGPLTILKNLARPFFCISDPEDIPLIDLQHPGDPLAGQFGTHTVPGAADNSTDDSLPIPPAIEELLPEIDVGDTTAPISAQPPASGLCGTQAFKKLELHATLNVATVADNNDFTGLTPAGQQGRRNCPAGEEGTLHIIADDVTVYSGGWIKGDGVNTGIPNNPNNPSDDNDDAPWFTTQASGNSGGSHIGSGGQGKFLSGNFGATNTTYGNTIDDLVSEAGARSGVSGVGSQGGGAYITVTAEIVDIRGGGQLSARGGDGAGTTCGSGFGGGGGGAGGGIVVNAARLENAGVISARGGTGGFGNGGGGGGGGGMVETRTSIRTGNDPFFFGAGGGGACAGNTAGDGGSDGQWRRLEQPQSRAHPKERFWNNGTGGMTVPYSAAAAVSSDGNDNFDVILCGVHLNSPPPNDKLDFSEGGAMPFFPPSFGAPCGSDFFTTRAVIGVAHVTNDDQVRFRDGAFVVSADRAEGFEGFYTVVMKPHDADNDQCFPIDSIFDFFGDCSVESFDVSGEPDAVVGIDNTAPNIVSSTPTDTGTHIVNKPSQTISFDVNDPSALSGLYSPPMLCKNENFTDYVECDVNVTWTLSPGDGLKVFSFKAKDNALNLTTERTIDFHLDTQAPSASSTVIPSIFNLVPSPNGFFRIPPTVRLSFVSDPPGGTGLTDDAVKFKYRWDDGTEQDCVGNPCDVSAVGLVTGSHTLHFTAIDKAGNRRVDDNDPATPAMHTQVVKIDGQDPLSALNTVPAQPDTLGFFTTKPFVVISSVDQVGGSGVTPGGTQEYRIGFETFPGSGVFPMPAGFTTYTAPFRLNEGVQKVCFRATDEAGNTNAEQCSDVIRVDDTAPSATAAIIPPVADGLAGWFVTDPVVHLDGYVDPGSGAPLFGRFRHRTDNEGFTGCNAACDAVGFFTGNHLFHWTAVDRVGNRRTEQTFNLKVDLDPPDTLVERMPNQPNGANGWYQKEPWIVLQASDQGDAGSGVATVRYGVDPAGGALPAASTVYTVPFQIQPGAWDLCVAATDVAGNTEPADCQVVKVDTDDPVVSILNPAPNGTNGWHISAFIAAGITSDTVPGSGVGNEAANMCAHLTHVDSPFVPSGTCISIDGRPFVPYLGAFVGIGEGLHSIRLYAVDLSGRRSLIELEDYQVDLSNPQTTFRTRPPDAASKGWWRGDDEPLVVLTALDGDQNAGVTKTEYRINGGPWTLYTGPFVAAEGIRTIDARSHDASSRIEPPKTKVVPVDITPPVATALYPTPSIWLKLLSLLGNLLGLSPKLSMLNWRVTENLSPTIRVNVIIYDLAGHVVRRLDGGTHAVTPGVPYQSFTYWDGKDNTLLGIVPLGIYYYRVVVVDEGGMWTQSGESKPIQIKLG